MPAGQICGLLGPNGAGKTTLFRLLMGILKASGGTLAIGGLDAFEDRVATKRLIGFVPDEPVFFSYLSGRETLALSAAMHGIGGRALRDATEPLMDPGVRLCARVVVLSRGTVVADDRLDALRAAHAGADLEAVFLQLTLGADGA